MADGFTVHFSVPELIVVGTFLGLSLLRELMHLVRTNLDEVLRFVRWWASFRRRLRIAQRSGS